MSHFSQPLTNRERDVDVLVVGTGLTNSIVAAALARAGQKVLHLDASNCYGGLWSSFSIEQLERFCTVTKSKYSESESDGVLSEAGTAGLKFRFGPISYLPRPGQVANEKVQNQQDSVSESASTRENSNSLSESVSGSQSQSANTSQSASPELDIKNDNQSQVSDSDADQWWSQLDKLPESNIIRYPIKHDIDWNKSFIYRNIQYDPYGFYNCKIETESDATEESQKSALKASDTVTGTSNSKEEASESASIPKMQSFTSSPEFQQFRYKQSNRFSIDLTPRLMFASSDFVDTAIESSVARYLEFQTPKSEPKMCKVELMKQQSGANSLSISDDSSKPLTFFSVPTSKSAVFQSKNLSLFEKRSLMKFMTGAVKKYSDLSERLQNHQLLIDLSGKFGNNNLDAFQSAAKMGRDAVEFRHKKEVESFDTEQSNSNATVTESDSNTVTASDSESDRKVVTKSDSSNLQTDSDTASKLTDDDVQFLNELDSYSSFVEYLKAQKLSPRLRDYICGVICLDSRHRPQDSNTDNTQAAAAATNNDNLNDQQISMISAPLGFALLQRYLRSMSVRRLASHAILFPMYGSGDVGQAFCRLAALHECVYALERGVADVYGIGNMETETHYLGIRTDKGDLVRCKQMIISEEQMQSDIRTTKEKQADNITQGQKILDQEKVKNKPKSQSYCVRRILITTKEVIPNSNTIMNESGDSESSDIANPSESSDTTTVDDPVSLSIITTDDPNKCPVQVLQLNSRTGVAPKGYYVVHLSQVVKKNDTDVDSDTDSDDKSALASDIEIVTRKLLKVKGCDEKNSMDQIPCYMSATYIQKLPYQQYPKSGEVEPESDTVPCNLYSNTTNMNHLNNNSDLISTTQPPQPGFILDHEISEARLLYYKVMKKLSSARHNDIIPKFLMTPEYVKAEQESEENESDESNNDFSGKNGFQQMSQEVEEALARSEDKGNSEKGKEKVTEEYGEQVVEKK